MLQASYALSASGKIVHDELVTMLKGTGTTESELTPPSPILMVGLQGSGSNHVGQISKAIARYDYARFDGFT